MSEPTRDGVDEVRKIGRLTVRICRDRCAEFKDCIGISPEAFEIGEDSIVRFANPEAVDEETLIDACSVCPVNALIVEDGGGNRIVPVR